MSIHLPQRICSDVHAALQREWLVTNGLGGFASGTVAGALTRRYHGLLVAALRPPVGRRLLVAKLDETARVEKQNYPLYTNIWHSGIEQPAGCRHLERFDLILGVPTWTFVLGRARVVKRIWMEPGQNVTFVRYELQRGSPRVRFSIRLLVNDRDYHHLTRAGDRGFYAQAADGELKIRMPECRQTVRVCCSGVPASDVKWHVDSVWCKGFELWVEAARGQDHREDHLAIGRCELRLRPGGAATFRISVGDARPNVDDTRQRYECRMQDRLSEFAGRVGRQADDLPVPVRQLALAAEQFIVARASPDEPDGHTVIAGYPWFTDWGRDTMIALPGLTLATGRPALARQILRTWARYIDQGMIPNRFPDAGDRPDYNTGDATLWYLWAIDQYFRATADVQTLGELFPVMQEIVAWHRRGTRHNLHVWDDGLVYGGEPGVNLTWMDAKIGDRVITPRIGKPVELSALWYDALCNMARLADLVGPPGDEYQRLAQTTRASFERFWNPSAGCCYDVLDGPDGNDPRVRPNQILAVSLTHSPLTREQQRAVVDTCERHLLTWFGLRSLAPGSGEYRGRYAGDLLQRDEAYHQGTVWGWLLGPFVLAHYRVHRDAARARHLLQPLLGQLWAAGIGTLAEVFDGDEPYRAGGCFAQAWTVGETLRAWDTLHATSESGATSERTLVRGMNAAARKPTR